QTGLRVADATARLRAHADAARSTTTRHLNTTSGSSGGNLVPQDGPPLFVAEEFATAARSTATLERALATRPLPESGMKVKIARLSGGATVDVQGASENATVSET